MTQIPSNERPAEVSAEEWGGFVAKLRAYVRRRVDGAGADDVLGDILLRLVQHRRQLAEARNPSAWVYRVAANAIADYYRRRAAEHRVIDRVGDGQPEPAVAPADESAAARELAACLEPLVRNLPATYAQAVQLTDIEGMTQAAAAQRLGLSVSGMKSRVQRGRARLKQALQRCCEIEVDAHGVVTDFRVRRDRCDC